MKPSLSGWLAMMLMPVVVCAQTEQAKSVSIQARIDAISMALSQKAVGKVEILQIPPRILTRAAITPEMLEKQYHNKMIIRDLEVTAYRDKMIDAFKSVSVKRRVDMADLRWGVIFYSRDETRIGAIYFDKFGRYGAVNDTASSFQGDFFHWLDATFSSCFQ